MIFCTCICYVYGLPVRVKMYNTTRPGQEIAVDMVRYQWENVQVLSGVLGGVRSCGVYVFDPREIARDVWWWLTGR